MKKLYTFLAVLSSTLATMAQIEVDKKIQLTGSGDDAKVEGIQKVINPTDAVNKAYVDSLFNVLLLQIPDNQVYFTLSSTLSSATVVQGLTTSTYMVASSYDSGELNGVTLSVPNMPVGMTANFGQSAGVPTFTSSISFTTTSATPSGVYDLDIIGLSGNYIDTVSVQITVEEGRFIWQTVNQYNGNLGGLAGADQKCNAEAAAAGLSGNYIALLSDGTVNMKDRVTFSSKFIRPDGLLVANSKNDLFDFTISNKIDVNAMGGTNPTDNPGRSFTGSGTNGMTKLYSETCNGWTSTSGAGETGENKSTTGGSFWSDGGNSCSTPTFLYCIGQ